MNSLINKFERKLINISNQKKKLVDLDEPVVSFTFDDFPKTSLTNAGGMLFKNGIRGTYYLACGLMDKFNDGVEICSQLDVSNAIKLGHEIGCHTYDHLDCQKVSLETLDMSLKKNANCIEKMTGFRPTSFSYPYGRVSFNSRRLVSSKFSSSRGIRGGVNYDFCDLSNLKANPVYSYGFDLNRYEELIKITVKKKGWLIFYTHDVSDQPSRYGCTPNELEKIVDLVIQYKVRASTIKEVMLKLNSRK